MIAAVELDRVKTAPTGVSWVVEAPNEAEPSVEMKVLILQDELSTEVTVAIENTRSFS